MVFLKTLDGEIVEQQPTNPTGGFEIQDVPKAIYEVTIRVKGFRPYERQINLSYGAGEYFLNIQLTPRATVVHRSSPSLTDLRAPKAARKELARGQQALNKRQAREAERFLKAAVKIYPCYARAQTDLGLTLSTLHQYKSAEAALRKAIHCDPGYLESYTVLGQLLNAEQRYADSEEVLENGLRLSPGSWQFYYGLGKADFGEGKYQAALQQFQKAEGMTPPAPPNVHLKLADAYVKLTAFDHAYREFATYLRVQPHGPFAPGVKRVMRQMRAAGVLHSSLTQDSGSSASPR
jgi:tetratricopeptide (TPR) repeat protein